jgi:hypothetical protein
MDLAVSLGAAYYGMVKSGVGVRVGSGSPRSYYVGVGDEVNGSGERSKQAVCLVERGLEEGSSIALPDRPLKVLANQPVSIDLFSSSYRSGDRCGDLVEVDDTLTALPALNTVIQYGSKGIRTEIPVNLEASYTEVGTLEIWCQSLSSPHRWQLRFQLRGDQKPIEVGDDDVFEASLVQGACQTIRDTFTSPTGKAHLPRIMADIAAVLDRPREKWPLSLLRTLADTLLEHESARKKSAETESRWMNLLGFCLRPGIGEGLDPHRVKTLWKQYKKGPVHATSAQVRLEWWILWRRVAAGLTAGQQRQVYQDIGSFLVPKKKSRLSRQELTEMWMAMANMERLLVKDKIVLGRQLIQGFQIRKPQPQLQWALSRIGSRDPLYGSIDRVIPPGEVGQWINELLSMSWKNPKPTVEMLSMSWKNPKPTVEMLSQLCRKTGDPLRDIDEDTRNSVVGWIETAGDFPEALARIATRSIRQQQEKNTVFGESLPAGLILDDTPS